MFKLYITSNSVHPLCIKNESTRNIWAELSFFKPQEHLTALACIFGTVPMLVASLIQTTKVRYLSSATLSNLPNPKQKPNPGLDFEKLGSVASIDSSHFVTSAGSFESLLRGVCLLEYLKYIIRNHIEMPGIEIFNNCKLPLALLIPKDLSCVNDPGKPFNLLDILNCFRIPFLGLSDMEWPQIYKDLFPLADHNCSVKLNTFSRRKNSDQLDGYFNVVDEFNGNYRICEAVMECKELSGTLEAGTMLSILKKAFRRMENSYSTLFHLLQFNGWNCI